VSLVSLLRATDHLPVGTGAYNVTVATDYLWCIFVCIAVDQGAANAASASGPTPLTSQRASLAKLP